MIRRLAARRTGLLAQSLTSAASSAGAQLLVAVVYVLAAREHSPASFGAVASSMAVATIVVGVVDFGTNSFWVRELARGALDGSVLRDRAVTKLLATAGAVLVVAWIASATGSGVSPLPVLLYGSLYAVGQVVQSPLRARLRFHFLALSALLDRSTALIVFLLLPVGGGATALILALSAGLVVSTVLNAWRMRVDGSAAGGGRLRIRNPWTGSAWYGLSSATSALQGLDLPIAAAVGGAAVGGTYAAVNKWTQPFGLLIGAFTSAVAPRAATISTARELWVLVRGAVVIPVVSVLAAIVFAIAAPALVPFLLGDRYAGSALVLQILAVSVIPGLFNQPLVVVMHSIGQDRASSILTSASVAVQLACLVPLVSLAGAAGAAWACLIFQSVLLVSHLVLLHRYARASSAPVADEVAVTVG